MYICKHAYIYVYVYTHSHGHTHTHTYTYTYGCIHSFAPQAHANVSTLHANTFTPHIQTQVRTNTHMCTHMHTRTHRHMLTHSHTHIHCSHTRSLCRILVDDFVFCMFNYIRHTHSNTHSHYTWHILKPEKPASSVVCAGTLAGIMRWALSVRTPFDGLVLQSRVSPCTHAHIVYTHTHTHVQKRLRSVLDISNQISASDNS